MDDIDVQEFIHINMDAFYASLGQRDNPALRGLPVAVGGSAARDVVATASYEARTLGVHSAMPSATAKPKCPDLTSVAPRFEVDGQVLQQIRKIFAEYTPLIEPLSLYGAYLDVTENLKGTEIALEIRAKINAVTGVDASTGISYNKFLAKRASDLNNLNGQAVKKFYGVRPATAERMKRHGIETRVDLKSKSLGFLQ